MSVPRPVPRQVVIVDDDPVILRLLERALEMLLGCEVTTFESALAALRHLANVTPESAAPASLLIIDHVMPEMDGSTLVRTIRQHPRMKTLAVLALSSTTRDRISELLAVGANSVLDKRTSPLEIAREAQRLMAGSAPLVARPTGS